jgi:hypothetical protein
VIHPPIPEYGPDVINSPIQVCGPVVSPGILGPEMGNPPWPGGVFRNSNTSPVPSGSSGASQGSNAAGAGASQGAAAGAGTGQASPSLRDIGELVPVEISRTGKISVKDIRENGRKIPLTADEEKLAHEIATQGDSRGTLTETLVDKVARRLGLTVLTGGQYGGGRNNGFDHVFQFQVPGKTDKNGNPLTFTIVLDSKPLSLPASGTAIKSFGTKVSNRGVGGTQQLSDDWLSNVLSKLDATSPARTAVNAASRDGTLYVGIIGVDPTDDGLILIRTK